MFADYEVIAELDRGGQGVVYRGVHKRTHRAVAIKVLREGPFAGPRDRARFEREVEILRQIDHPNVVAIRDCGVAAGRQYLVTDYIDGTPLDVWIADCGLRMADCTERSARQDAIDALVSLFGQICDAVNAAHLMGVIHRDLKPSNILIDKAGQPHVLDFGLAKVAAGTGIAAGTGVPGPSLQPSAV
jgi:serine/threonine-protein kinase